VYLTNKLKQTAR